MLKGQISVGDYVKVVSFLRANYPLNNVVLVSPGGDVDEALKIGGLFRKYLISTIAPTDLGGGSTYLSAPNVRVKTVGRARARVRLFGLAE